MAEIALFGAEQEAFSTQACYEVMEQLKKQTAFNLLIVVGEDSQHKSKASRQPEARKDSARDRGRYRAKRQMRMQTLGLLCGIKRIATSRATGG